eukprot:GHVO01028144.1.p1 GENE.GHVO01028144.1~~GHVO01028144.1.p1  ORF type:complete len:343 (+),score=51.03 GHVO01028144.1:29-1030(+)
MSEPEIPVCDVSSDMTLMREEINLLKEQQAELFKKQHQLQERVLHMAGATHGNRRDIAEWSIPSLVMYTGELLGADRMEYDVERMTQGDTVEFIKIQKQLRRFVSRSQRSERDSKEVVQNMREHFDAMVLPKIVTMAQFVSFVEGLYDQAVIKTIALLKKCRASMVKRDATSVYMNAFIVISILEKGVLSSHMKTATFRRDDPEDVKRKCRLDIAKANLDSQNYFLDSDENTKKRNALLYNFGRRIEDRSLSDLNALEKQGFLAFRSHLQDDSVDTALLIEDMRRVTPLAPVLSQRMNELRATISDEDILTPPMVEAPSPVENKRIKTSDPLE